MLGGIVGYRCIYCQQRNALGVTSQECIQKMILDGCTTNVSIMCRCGAINTINKGTIIESRQKRR